ncbi:MAG: hypothetical protein ACT4QA_08725 [Panacagrimonas sp.]
MAVLAGIPMTAMAEDAAGLDLTMQVLGKNDKVDDRLVNRILVPGIGAARAAQGSGDRNSAKERQALREDNREARKEQREEALERYRDRRDRSE